MNAPDQATVYFSHHALSLKGLPELEKEQVQRYFDRKDLEVIDSKEALGEKLHRMKGMSKKPVCLLVMSSGTFDGFDWNSLSSQYN